MNTEPKPKTREEIIEDIQTHNEILTPVIMSEYLTMLSVYLSSMAEDYANKSKLYYKKWVEIRETTETDGQAEKRAKATDEYYDKNLLDRQWKATIEMIQSLKKRLGMFNDEYNTSGNQ